MLRALTAHPAFVDELSRARSHIKTARESTAASYQSVFVTALARDARAPTDRMRRIRSSQSSARCLSWLANAMFRSLPFPRPLSDRVLCAYSHLPPSMISKQLMPASVSPVTLLRSLSRPYLRPLLDHLAALRFLEPAPFGGGGSGGDPGEVDDKEDGSDRSLTPGSGSGSDESFADMVAALFAPLPLC